MKKTLKAVVVLAVAAGIYALATPTPAYAGKGSCATVRCAACPDGQHLRLHWPNCCDCVPN